eukprot:gene33232-42970_t
MSKQIVKTIREKGMGIASCGGGRRILDNTIVNEADFKEICRRVPSDEDATREVGYRLELINNKIVLTEYPSSP